MAKKLWLFRPSAPQSTKMRRERVRAERIEAQADQEPKRMLVKGTLAMSILSPLMAKEEPTSVVPRLEISSTYAGLLSRHWHQI